MAESVKVMVRCRPMSTKEKQRNCVTVVEMDEKNKQVAIFKPNEKDQAKSFTFDYVFGPQTAQQIIYQQTAFSLVNNVLQGYNGTIFAYGQTGCGKTFTMMGLPTSQSQRGIIPRTFSQIVTVTGAERIKNYMVWCSFIEIYNEEIHDLLAKDIKQKKELRESPERGVFVEELTKIVVKTTAEMERYMEVGFKNRAVRETEMNKESSRSHSIFTIYIESSENDDKGIEKFKAGKLNLVDLAGSERQSKTNVTGDGMKQAAKINLSLSALGNVITALVTGKTAHVPYRDSKLTRLLQDSLGGNTKTIMIAAVSPAHYNYQQSVSTLRYASRAKQIQNKPKINQDPKDAQLRQFQAQIKRLKLMLQGKIPVQLVNRPGISTENKQNASELEQQLRRKQMMLNDEKEERAKLAQQLESLQKLVSHEPNMTDSAELEKIKKLSEKLKQQKKKEEEYLEEKRRREEELLNIEKNYRGLNEEVDEMREKFKDIKKKYVSSLTQLRDVQLEHENDKEQLLDTIRYQQKQIKRYAAIMNVLMNPQHLNQIMDMCEWSEERRDFIVPSFTYRDKNLGFPKLSAQQTKDLLDSQRQKKQVIFRQPRFDFPRSSSINDPQQSSPRFRGKPPKNDLRLNNIVRDAREGNHQVLSGGGNTVRSTSMSRQFQLTPIKNPVSTSDSDRMKQRQGSVASIQKLNTRRLQPILRISAQDSGGFDRYK